MNDTQISTVAELEQEHLIGTQVDRVELVAVLNQDGVSVFEGHCPHQGTLLAEGHIEDGRLICRGHGWQYNSLSGVKNDDEQICLHRFSAAMDDGKVLVDREEIAAWAQGHKRAAEPAGQRPLIIPEELPGPRGLPLFCHLHGYGCIWQTVLHGILAHFRGGPAYVRRAAWSYS